MNWSKDLPRDAPLALVVHLDKPADLADAAAVLREAVPSFFAERAPSERRRLRELLARGRTSLAIGLAPVSAIWSGASDAGGAELDPNIVNPFLNLGVLYAYAGDRAASDRARRAAELAPRAALVRAWLAINAVATGNTSAALEELSRLEQMLRNDPPIVLLSEMAYAGASVVSTRRSGSSSAWRPRRRIATSARADGRSLISGSETSGGRSSSSSKRP